MAASGGSDDNQELQPCGDQGGAVVKRSDQQHALIPASIQGENVNLGNTQNVVAGDYIGHVDRHIETNIETQVVYNIGDQENKRRKLDILDFNLGSVRRQLKAEYLETRGKLPLLPGMPEKFAKMEDLFVNLHIYYVFKVGLTRMV
ncbi:uncharacterized protein [Amphiura filiformis]|uniref:uncharacterized protein n=1 Tax=Amphiura filiformis TaxID=82378 RepID=UPI003B20EF8B